MNVHTIYSRCLKRGQALVWFSLLIVLVFMPITAFLLDISMMVLERHNMQKAVDAAALTAANAFLNAPDSVRNNAYDFEMYVNSNVESISERNGFPGEYNIEIGGLPATMNVAPNGSVTLIRQHTYLFGSIIGLSSAEISVTALIIPQTTANHLDVYAPPIELR